MSGAEHLRELLRPLGEPLPPWVFPCGNCQRIHRTVDTVTLQGEAAGRKAAELLAAIAGISVGDAARLSCSVGVAMAPEDGARYEDLVEAADQRAYRAKGLGKNQVCAQ